MNAYLIFYRDAEVDYIEKINETFESVGSFVDWVRANKEIPQREIKEFPSTNKILAQSILRFEETKIGRGTSVCLINPDYDEICYDREADFNIPNLKTHYKTR